jgi:hypothetical protein
MPRYGTSKDMRKRCLSCHATPCRQQEGEVLQFLLVLDLGTRWGRVASVTALPHFTPRERTTRYPLDRRLGGPQSWTDCKLSALYHKVMVYYRSRNQSIFNVWTLSGCSREVRKQALVYWDSVIMDIRSFEICVILKQRENAAFICRNR